MFAFGPLSILRDCLAYVSAHLTSEFEVIALVHRRDLFSYPGITYIELPRSRSSWFLRLFYEHIYFRRLSKLWRPLLWLSLHDISPTVEATVQAVYCHNATPFYKPSWRETLLDPKFAIFCWFYGLVYRLNLKRNELIIVQQAWMRRQFASRYGARRVLVAHPAVHRNPVISADRQVSDREYCFLYPTFPRVFKNCEVIVDAARLLMARGITNFSVILTFTGDENFYARRIRQRCQDISQIRFVGSCDRDDIWQLYGRADCLLFPSRLETWGLPITEFKCFQKPLVVADLDYAHETVGSYDKAAFFPPNDAESLARAMQSLLEGTMAFAPHRSSPIGEPYAADWAEMFRLLLAGHSPAADGTRGEKVAYLGDA